MIRPCLFIALGVLLVACDGRGETPGRPDIQGRYAFAGSIAATLEIRRERGDRYIAALAGGSPRDAGASAPADCYVRAVGALQDGTLDAAFTSVDTATFRYSQTRAEREGRRLQIVFRSGGAEVTRADTDGYCGLGATFVGSYRRAQ